VTTFTATNTTDALASATATVTTVLTGAASQLTVDPITAVNAGSAQTVKVYVKDANGNLVTSYNGAVTLAATGGAVVTSPVNASKGIATFTVNSATAQTVTYTVGIASPALSATATGVFNPGAATQITTSASPASIIADGSSITTITVKALDANGNVVTAENGTATITIPTGNDYASLLATTAQLTNGVGTVNVRAKTLVGTANVTASYTVIGATTAVTSTVAVNTVAGAVSASLSTVNGFNNQSSSQNQNVFVVEVFVKDAYTNAVTGLQTPDFAVTVAGAPQQINNIFNQGNGLYIFTVTGNSNDVVVVKVNGVTLTATTTIQ
jgi:adhesin/invasin